MRSILRVMIQKVLYLMANSVLHQIFDSYKVMEPQKYFKGDKKCSSHHDTEQALGRL
uniref:Uncharacterized protein n=1 Tax=Arundo donax TaxID=35708 RepID=A0A0A9B5C4_ARUDO